jgi:hypothetical protein
MLNRVVYFGALGRLLQYLLPRNESRSRYVQCTYISAASAFVEPAIRLWTDGVNVLRFGRGGLSRRHISMYTIAIPETPKQAHKGRLTLILVAPLTDFSKELDILNCDLNNWLATAGSRGSQWGPYRSRVCECCEQSLEFGILHLRSEKDVFLLGP